MSRRVLKHVMHVTGPETLQSTQGPGKARWAPLTKPAGRAAQLDYDAVLHAQVELEAYRRDTKGGEGLQQEVRKLRSEASSLPSP